MPKMFRAGNKFWVFFGLLSVTFRVFTGAPEAQVNFTSIFVDQKIKVDSEVSAFKFLESAVADNSTDANSIPEKHHTYSTYKKYISPDNHLINLVHDVQYSIPAASKILFTPSGFKETLKIKPNSHSPPAVVSALTPTHTTTTDSSVVLEKKFEKGKNTYLGEFGSVSLRN